jgi:hypothetical protein
MKKAVFLMLSAMAILFCGCTAGSGYAPGYAPGYALINSNTHPPLKAADGSGVCLPISAKSSLKIDVECILEYVQGDSTFDPADERTDPLTPWISLNYSF